MKSIVRMRTIRWALLIVSVSVCARAQNNSQPQPDTTPSPAFGQNAPVLNPDNPPVTGLDVPSLELRTASRSFFSPALQVSESGQSNGPDELGGSGWESVSRVLGAFDLQQFWPKSDLFLEYLGGGAFYSSPDVKQLHAAGLEAVTRWRTGQVTLRDSFSYLPDGTFQVGTYGGLPGLGLSAGGLGAGVLGGGLPGIHPTDQGGLGTIPRLANTAILDAVQAINPVSALTVVGGFSNTHFYDPKDFLVNGDQITVEGGYSHLVNRRDQIGLVYAFQLLQFPQVSGGQVYVDILNVRWSHTITGKLSLIAGIGPQYTELEQGGNQKSWTVSAKVQLRYKMGHASMEALFEKFTSPGSGFFAGANTESARFGYRRPLGRTWEFFGDMGYSYNTRLQPDAIGAVNAHNYNDGSAGIVLRKHLGRSYDFFAGYRFSELAFDTATCLVGTGGTSSNCGRIAQQHIATIGVEWHPKPTRIE